MREERVLAAEKVPVRIGGRELTASPLRNSDFAEFRSWAKAKKIRVLLESGMSTINEPFFSKKVDEILNEKPTVILEEGKPPHVEDKLLDDLSTPEGLRYLVYLSLRRAHPSLKYEDVDGSVDEVNAAVDLIMPISLPLRKETKPGEEPPLSETQSG